MTQASGWQQPTDRKSGKGSKVALLLIGVVLIIGVITAMGGRERERIQSAAPAGYQAEYGGQPSVYSRIASTTSCSDLQSEFDIASANNDREEPGTAGHRATLGYMTAIVDRMDTVGCS